MDFLAPFEEGEIVHVSVAEARNHDITFAHFIFIIELGTTNKKYVHDRLLKTTVRQEVITRVKSA